MRVGSNGRICLIVTEVVDLHNDALKHGLRVEYPVSGPSLSNCCFEFDFEHYITNFVFPSSSI